MGLALTDADLHAGDDDATDLTPDEKVGLIPTWIITRADLNRAEALNIAKGMRWARKNRPDILDPDVLMTLHKRLFSDVWKWAGATRQSEKNIGVADWWRLQEHLYMLLGDVRAQVEGGWRPMEEIAIDFHHRLVAIHLFPNGNGRHARMAADLLIEQLGGKPFSWGSENLVDPGETRAAYVAALRAADKHDLGPLLAFARS